MANDKQVASSFFFGRKLKLTAVDPLVIIANDIVRSTEAYKVHRTYSAIATGAVELLNPLWKCGEYYVLLPDSLHYSCQS